MERDLENRATSASKKLDQVKYLINVIHKILIDIYIFVIKIAVEIKMLQSMFSLKAFDTLNISSRTCLI